MMNIEVQITLTMLRGRPRRIIADLVGQHKIQAVKVEKQLLGVLGRSILGRTHSLHPLCKI